MMIALGTWKVDTMMVMVMMMVTALMEVAEQLLVKYLAIELVV